MEHTLSCSSRIPAVTSIANIFIDRYMMNANGTYIKIYLYFSRCIQAGYKDMSVSGIADKMEITEKDVLRALQYWEKQGLMTLSYDKHAELKSIELVVPGETPSEHRQYTPEKNTTAIEQPHTVTPEISYDKNIAPMTKETNSEAKYVTEFKVTNKTTPNSNAEKAFDDENFTWTCHVIESYLNRTLSSGDIQLISYLYETLGFSSDLLLYLYEYCISMRKTNVNYIQAVALAWNDENIKTPEEAKIKTTNYNSVYTAVSKAFGLGRPLAMIEKKFVDRWQNDWEMDLSVIINACNRTMLKIHNADFKYTEGILDNWQKSNIRTLQDIEKADKAYAEIQANKKAQFTTKKPVTVFNNITKNQFKSFQQRNPSQSEIDELERKLLNRY